MNCYCGKIADTKCQVYKVKDYKLMCFTCAISWLYTTASCEKCRKGPDECLHTKEGRSVPVLSSTGEWHSKKKPGIFLDRGITPLTFSSLNS